MILDPSAVIAILADEPEGRAFREAIRDQDGVMISAAGFLEVAIVLDSRANRHELSAELDLFMAWAGATIMPVTPGQARIAREAHRYYGRGSGHPARLNFGDCFTYALAKENVEPLLFKGNDFAQTDVTPVVGPSPAAQITGVDQ